MTIGGTTYPVSGLHFVNIQYFTVLVMHSKRSYCGHTKILGATPAGWPFCPHATGRTSRLGGHKHVFSHFNHTVRGYKYLNGRMSHIMLKLTEKSYDTNIKVADLGSVHTLKHTKT